MADNGVPVEPIDQLPVIELAMLSDDELREARTGANVPILGLQQALDQPYVPEAYEDINNRGHRWGDTKARFPNRTLWVVNANAVRARVDLVFGQYGYGWKDECQVLGLITERREKTSDRTKVDTWHIVDVRYSFHFLVRWTDGQGNTRRAWAKLPDLYDSDEMTSRGFVYRAARSVGLKQTVKYLGGFRHISGDFTSSGEDEDNVRRREENDVPDAAPQAPQAGNNGAKAPGKAKTKTSDKPSPSIQQGDDLVPVDRVKPDTLVKDTDLSWLTESFRPTTLAKCGEWPWRELAQKVPSAVTFFEGSQARTPDVILAAIRAGQSGGQTESTPSVAEGTPAPQT